MERGFVTYSEAFKMQVVEGIRQGKFATIFQAQKAYCICGATTIKKWIKKYGKEELLPKRIKVETMAAVKKVLNPESNNLVNIHKLLPSTSW